MIKNLRGRVHLAQNSKHFLVNKWTVFFQVHLCILFKHGSHLTGREKRRFSVDLFIPRPLYRGILVTVTFKPVEEILWCYRSHETSLLELSHSTTYFFLFYKKIRSVLLLFFYYYYHYHYHYHHHHHHYYYYYYYYYHYHHHHYYYYYNYYYYFPLASIKS